MQKLTKAEVQEMEKLVAAVAEAYTALDEEVDVFNAAVATHWVDVAVAQTNYNDALEAWNTWRLQVGADGREFFEGRSQKWQESPKGQAYEAWIEPFEHEDAFLPSELEAPDELALEIDDPRDDMYDVAEEPPAAD
jgi:hypothetical protein